MNYTAISKRFFSIDTTSISNVCIVEEYNKKSDHNYSDSQHGFRFTIPNTRNKYFHSARLIYLIIHLLLIKLECANSQKYQNIYRQFFPISLAFLLFATLNEKVKEVDNTVLFKVLKCFNIFNNYDIFNILK